MEMGKLQGDEKISVEHWDLESSYTSRFVVLRKEMKPFHFTVMRKVDARKERREQRKIKAISVFLRLMLVA